MTIIRKIFVYLTCWKLVFDKGRPEGKVSGDHCPPDINRVSYKIGIFLHKADLGYSATIRQSLYLTSHVGSI